MQAALWWPESRWVTPPEAATLLAAEKGRSWGCVFNIHIFSGAPGLARQQEPGEGQRHSTSMVLEIRSHIGASC